MPAKVAVIGSGISGISAAHKLIENNCAVIIFDQGKNPGGRLGLRSLRNIPFVNRPVDVGAAYFTISDPIFQNKVDSVTIEWKTNENSMPSIVQSHDDALKFKSIEHLGLA